MITEPVIGSVLIAGVSSLIWLAVFIVIAVVSSFFKKKSESEDEWELPSELKPRRDELPPLQRPVASRWEEELRRTLQQHPAPAAPPPIVQQLPPREVRPVYRHVHEDPAAEEEPHIQVALPVPQPFTEHIFQPLPGLTESTQRYAQASTLEERVQKHMQSVSGQRVGTTSVHHTELPPEVRALVDSFRNPRGVRSAILASIILGPPRAFDS
ncbi:MAG TPA: hypothetical protein VGF13_13890 [Verrucomicrobiae bacterium]